VVTHIPNGTTIHLYLMFADSYTLFLDVQENRDHQGIQIYNRTSTDEIQNTTINGNEVRYLKTNNLKNKMTSRILIDSKMFINM